MSREAIAKEIIESIQKYLESIKMKKQFKVGDIIEGVGQIKSIEKTKPEFKVGDKVKFRFDETPKRVGVIADICHASNPSTIAVKDADGVIYTAIPSYLKKVKDKQPQLLPFNLEEALAGKPVVTRDGREVTEFRKVNNVLYMNIAGKEYAGLMYMFNSGGKSDLFMKPEPKKKKTYWVNVYSEIASNEVNPVKRDFYVGCQHYNTKEEAYAKRGAMFIKTIKIKL